MSGNFFSRRAGGHRRRRGRAGGQGLVAYDAHEFERLVGRTTSELIEQFGPGTSARSCTWDDLVLL